MLNKKELKEKVVEQINNNIKNIVVDSIKDILTGNYNSKIKEIFYFNQFGERISLIKDTNNKQVKENIEENEKLDKVVEDIKKTVNSTAFEGVFVQIEYVNLENVKKYLSTNFKEVFKDEVDKEEKRLEEVENGFRIKEILEENGYSVGPIEVYSTLQIKDIHYQTQDIRKRKVKINFWGEKDMDNNGNIVLNGSFDINTSGSTYNLEEIKEYQDQLNRAVKTLEEIKEVFPKYFK